MEILYVDELYHHGVKGMRWGVRRYQNEDGSLKPAGVKRAAALRRKFTKYTQDDPEAEYSRKGTKMKLKYSQITGQELTRFKTKKDIENENASRKKSMKEMTDDELRAAIQRKQLENQYMQLQPKAPEKFSKKAFDSVKDAALTAVSEAIKENGRKYLSKLISDKLGLNEKTADQILSDSVNKAQKNANLAKAIFEEAEAKGKLEKIKSGEWVYQKNDKKKNKKDDDDDDDDDRNNVSHSTSSNNNTPNSQSKSIVNEIKNSKSVKTEPTKQATQKPETTKPPVTDFSNAPKKEEETNGFVPILYRAGKKLTKTVYNKK